MVDKIKEKCKTCEKQCMQEDLDRSRGVEPTLMDREVVEKLLRSYREVRSFLNRSTSCRDAIKGPEEISIDPPNCQIAIEIAIRGS